MRLFYLVALVAILEGCSWKFQVIKDLHHAPDGSLQVEKCLYKVSAPFGFLSFKVVTCNTEPVQATTAAPVEPAK